MCRSTHCVFIFARTRASHTYLLIDSWWVVMLWLLLLLLLLFVVVIAVRSHSSSHVESQPMCILSAPARSPYCIRNLGIFIDARVGTNFHSSAQREYFVRRCASVEFDFFSIIRLLWWHLLRHFPEWKMSPLGASGRHISNVLSQVHLSIFCCRCCCKRCAWCWCCWLAFLSAEH